MAFWKETANYKFAQRLLSHSVESKKAWKFSFIHLALSIGSINITNRGDPLSLPVTNQRIIASALTHSISVFHKFSDAGERILHYFIQKWMLLFLLWVQKYVLKNLHFSFQIFIFCQDISGTKSEVLTFRAWVSAAFTSFEVIDFSVYNFLAHVVLYLYK